MDITFAHQDGRTFSYRCRDRRDGAGLLMADMLPGERARLKADGKRLVNDAFEPAEDGEWTETSAQGGHTWVRRMRLVLTTEPIQAPRVDLRRPKMPAGLTPRQQDEWRYDQGHNEGGEGFNPHREGAASTYRRAR